MIPDNFYKIHQALYTALLEAANFLDSQSYPKLKNFLDYGNLEYILEPESLHADPFWHVSTLVEIFEKEQDSRTFLYDCMDASIDAYTCLGEEEKENVDRRLDIFWTYKIVAATIFFLREHGYKQQADRLMSAVEQANDL